MADAQHAGRKYDIRPKHIVIGVLVIILVVFALLNTDDASVNWILDTVNAPLIVVIVVSAVLGFVIGWFIGARRRGE